MLDQAATDIQVGYSIVTIALLEVSLTELETELVDGVTYGYKIAIKHEIIHESKLLQITVDATLLMDDESDESDVKKQLAKLSVGYQYAITNFESLELVNGMIPREAADMLNGESISTTRGIFFSHLRGTALHGILIPRIDTSGLRLSDVASKK